MTPCMVCYQVILQYRETIKRTGDRSMQEVLQFALSAVLYLCKTCVFSKRRVWIQILFWETCSSCEDGNSLVLLHAPAWERTIPLEKTAFDFWTLLVAWPCTKPLLYSWARAVRNTDLTECRANSGGVRIMVAQIWVMLNYKLVDWHMPVCNKFIAMENAWIAYKHLHCPQQT